MFAMAAQFGIVGQENADIMKHGGFLDKVKIRLQMGHFFGGRGGFAGHSIPVLDKYLIGLGAGIVKFIYYVKRIHSTPIRLNCNGKRYPLST